VAYYWKIGDKYNCPTKWRTDHYCAAQGKLVLFYPEGLANPSSAWPTMRNQKGFNGIINLAPNYIDAAISMGFNFKNLICKVPSDVSDLSSWMQLAFRKGVHNFYFDEPCTHKGNGNGINYTLESAYSLLHPNGGVLWAADVCSVGRCSSGNTAISDCVTVMLNHSDHIGCDDYYAAAPGRSCSGCDTNIVPPSMDVICAYDEFRTNFGAKFDFIWIYGGKSSLADEISCYGAEFDWMSNHGGINAIALYIDSNSDWAHVDAFCDQAYKHGYLNMVYRQFHSVYICVENNVTFPPACSGGSDYGIWDTSRQAYVKCDNPDNPDCVLVWSWNGNVDDNGWSNPTPFGSNPTYYGVSSPCP